MLVNEIIVLGNHIPDAKHAIGEAYYQVNGFIGHGYIVR
jgi:hypothetical protein